MNLFNSLFKNKKMVIQSPKFTTLLDIERKNLAQYSSSVANLKGEGLNFALKAISECKSRIQKIKAGQCENHVFQTHASIVRKSYKVKGEKLHEYEVSFEESVYTFCLFGNECFDKGSTVFEKKHVLGLFKEQVGSQKAAYIN